MVIFHSYVKLPEAKYFWNRGEGSAKMCVVSFNIHIGGALRKEGSASHHRLKILRWFIPGEPSKNRYIVTNIYKYYMVQVNERQSTLESTVSDLMNNNDNDLWKFKTIDESSATKHRNLGCLLVLRCFKPFPKIRKLQFVTLHFYVGRNSCSILSGATSTFLRDFLGKPMRG